MSAVAIEFDDVGLTFAPASSAPTTALEAVSCGFEPGKVTALIGPSGCGKSTLLQIARGFLEPTRGMLRFLERTDGKVTARPAMSTVWQAFNLFPWLTVMDNVAFGLDLAGIAKSERDARARHAIAAVDLAGFEDRYPRQLSGGMRQRVGLARALVMEPEVLLLDEPFGALDAQTRSMMQESLLALWSEFGNTVVFVTHDVDEAVFLGSRVVVMSASPGRLIADIPVPLPRPRDPAVLTAPEFITIKRQCLGLIREETLKAFAQANGA